MSNPITTTNATVATQAESNRPNYRIYDRTGGGVTEDIYAESLEDAIEQGREWIEGGEWGGHGNREDSGEGRVYRTIKLECSVGEIIRDEDGEVDHRATFEGAHDCSGTYSDDLPDCEARDVYPTDTPDHLHSDQDAEGHIWVDMGSPRGGRGTYLHHTDRCKLCGQYRECTTGGREDCNPDKPLAVTTIKDRDEESEAWLKETHRDEDGYLPEWLAEMLGCSVSIRMTDEQAREYVESHDDSDTLDEDDLEHAFAATFGRRADDDDRAVGLWSLLNA